MFHSTAYVNGTVYTMESEGDKCSAFVVQDGKFVYCGSDEEAKKLADEVVDLHGAAVLPGMIDTHQHLLAYASGLAKLNLKAAKSLEQLKQMLHDYAKDVPAGEWILGVGFDNEKFEGSKAMPTRWDLDEACADHPVLLSRYCLHFFSANSMALKLGGIDRNYQPPVEGNVKYDENGEPNGVICDGAGTHVLSIVPDKLASFDAKKDIIVKALHQLNSYGLTGVHPIQGKHCDLMEYTDIYQALKDEGRLTARIYINYDVLPGCNIRTGLGDEMLKFGFYKSYMDGNLSGRTAFMLEPYSDDPSTCGVCNYESQEAITEHLREGYQQGMQIGVHAIGDRAADMLITAIETIYHEDPHPDPRFRLIHMTTLNASLVERMSKLPVIVDVQPVFIPINVRSADSRMGDTERGAYTFAYKKMMDAGLILTGGSDSPCDSFNPLDGVYALVNRKDYTGYPEGGWHPQECIGVYDALRMYTYNAAYSSYEETIKGTIKEGKLADFVVLDADIFKVDPMKIKDIKVEKTFLGGKLVYSRD